jgi:hypothetical protein
VCGAAVAIVISALHLSLNDGDRTDADQQGSVAMEKIVQALNSSCVVGVGVSPIVGVSGSSGATGSTAAPPSSNNSLTLYSSLTDTPAITDPSEIVIYLSSTNGPLDMATYQYSTGASGYSATPSSVFDLIPHAAPVGSSGASGSTTPIFTYYGYDPSTGATNAAATSEIGINLQAQPSDGNDPLHAAVDLSDEVVLRLTAVSNYPEGGSSGATGVSPCA